MVNKNKILLKSKISIIMLKNIRIKMLGFLEFFQEE